MLPEMPQTPCMFDSELVFSGCTLKSTVSFSKLFVTTHILCHMTPDEVTVYSLRSCGSVGREVEDQEAVFGEDSMLCDSVA